MYVVGFQEFEVIQGRYAVNLQKRSCGCRHWQLTGIPCDHVVAGIASLNLNAKEFVDDCFKKETFLKCYAYTISPLNDSSLWPHVEDLHIPLPPKRRRLPGRPSHKRKINEAERELSRKKNHSISRKGEQQFCRLCGGSGHNKRNCPTMAQSTGAGPSTAQIKKQPKQKKKKEKQAAPPGTKAGATAALSGSKIGAGAAPSALKAGASSNAGKGKGKDEQVHEKKREASDASPGRTRCPSERITRNKLKKNVVPKDGSGCRKDKPCSLD